MNPPELLSPRLSHLDPFSRAVQLHWRLLLAAATGLVLLLVLPRGWSTSTRLLTIWDAGVGVYLILSVALTFRHDLGRLRQRAAEQDEGAAAVTILSALAALASLGATFVELSGAKGHAQDSLFHIVLAVGTIALSWLFIHTIFAQHYAHDYYGGRDERTGGLTFPGEKSPDYWDFLYFSLVVGMTSQVSDVAVTSGRLRRIVAAHGVLAFVFNTTIIALTVNIASSVL